MGSNPKSLEFAQWLRGQMSKRDISQRALGKRLDPEMPERGRRQVVRHLGGGHYPTKAYRDAYALILGEEFVDLDEEPRAVNLADELFVLARDHRAVGRRLDRIMRAVA